MLSSSKLCVHWSKQIHKICRFIFLFLGVLLIGCSHSELIVPTITLLQPMLQELGKQNPQVMRLIQQHQAEFLQLINEPHEGAEGWDHLTCPCPSVCLLVTVVGWNNLLLISSSSQVTSCLANPQLPLLKFWHFLSYLYPCCMASLPKIPL